MVRAELFGGGGVPAPFFNPAWRSRIGVELEMFTMVPDPAGGLAQADLHGGQSSIAGLFDVLRCGGAWRESKPGAFALVNDAGGRLSLEPAGQLEYSGPPHASVRAALDDLDTTVSSLEAVCALHGIEIVARGFNDLCRPDSLRLLVRSPRYVAMDEHFQSIGAFGRMMMRATCALQINLDFGPPSAAPSRWRLANMMAPSLNAIFANSAHHHEGRAYRSFRYEIWRRADPSRTGRLLDSPDLDPVDDYLRFAMAASVMLVRDRGGERRPAAPMTFQQWLGGVAEHQYPDMDDWRLHLSTLFPDVRARGWMELRSIDAPPPEWRGVPIALAATLLYDDGVRAEALRRLEGRDRYRDAGHEHDGHWQCDFDTGVELFALALDHIDDPRIAAVAREYYERFCLNGITPADVELAAAQAG